uniref:Putative LOC100871724 [Apis florea] n=1 Tax=Lepeophtheirus salmonis TaxID=72036 RepID=A0A0K2UVN9_LEPSM
MMSRIRLWFPLGYLIFLISFVSSHIAWTNIQTSLVEGQVDTWTKSLSGCPCKNGTQSDKDGDCACCMEDSGGCQCGIGVTNRCGQCGLEEFCDNTQVAQLVSARYL